MTLEILLPFQVFLRKSGVTRVVAETRSGSFGLLPRRLDCVAALTPGILVYETEQEGEAYVAIDEGVMVKTGPTVMVSVRHAHAGSDLSRLRASVETEFRVQREAEREASSVLARLEAGFLRRFARLRRD
jgi:F-type H+-transporting ATPase subunit epsilon